MTLHAVPDTAPADDAAPLDRDAADRITAALALALEDADTLLAEAVTARVWEAYGLASFAAYVDAKLPQLSMLRIRSKPVRRQVVAALYAGGPAEGGRSMADVAALVGISTGQVHADVKRAAADAAAPLATVTPLRPDQPATAPAELPPLSELMTRALRLIVDAGPAGLTSLELEKATRWRHGRVSSLLHRLERAQLAGRPGAAGHLAGADRIVRDGYAAYVGTL